MRRAPSYALSLAIWVVRRAIETIGHPVAVAVAKPYAAIEHPTAITLHPSGRRVVIAVARADPVAGDPHVAVATPVPITGSPHVTHARRGHHFLAHRRRADSNDDVDIGTSVCPNSEASERGRDQACNRQLSHGIISLIASTQPPGLGLPERKRRGPLQGSGPT